MARIQVIDDDSDIRYVARRFLEMAGHQVSEAADGEEGLKMLEMYKPNLILLDIMLPGMNGWEICRRIKTDEKLKHIPVAMFSIRGDDEDIRKSRLFNADEHITKPIEREAFLETVRTLLDRSGPF
jgi:two-component system phosphate regulon response regulator PhoB